VSGARCRVSRQTEEPIGQSCRAKIRGGGYNLKIKAKKNKKREDRGEKNRARSSTQSPKASVTLTGAFGEKNDAHPSKKGGTGTSLGPLSY